MGSDSFPTTGDRSCVPLILYEHEYATTGRRACRAQRRVRLDAASLVSCRFRRAGLRGVETVASALCRRHRAAVGRTGQRDCAINRVRNATYFLPNVPPGWSHPRVVSSPLNDFVPRQILHPSGQSPAPGRMGPIPRQKSHNSKPFPDHPGCRGDQAQKGLCRASLVNTQSPSFGRNEPCCAGQWGSAYHSPCATLRGVRLVPALTT